VPYSGLSNIVVIAQGKNNKTTHSIMRPSFTVSLARLFIRHVDLPSVDSVDNVMWRAAVDGATYGLCRTEDFLDAASKILRERLGLHSPCNLVDLIERDIASVLNIFLLLAIPWGLYIWGSTKRESDGKKGGDDRTFECPDDEGRCRRYDGDLGLTVLDSELNSDAQTLPSGGRLCNVFSDLFGGLRKKSRNAMVPQRWCIRTRPRGPILGASAEEAPTSPPVARR
jgi:hypothetical protein